MDLERELEQKDVLLAHRMKGDIDEVTENARILPRVGTDCGQAPGPGHVAQW